MRQRNASVRSPSIWQRPFAVWDAGQRSWRARVWVPALLGAVAVHAVVVATPARPLRDSLAYVELGRALADGEGYHLFGVRDHLWPPGLPLLLAGTSRAAPDAVRSPRAMLAGWLFLAAWLTYRLGRPLIGPRLAALVAMAGLLNPAVVRLQRSVLSEPAFAALTVAAIACWSAWHRRAVRGWHWIVLGAAAAAGAALLRGIGVVVGPALAMATLVSLPARQGESGRGTLEGNCIVPRSGARRSLVHMAVVAGLWLAGTAAGLGAGWVIEGGRGGVRGYLAVAQRTGPYAAAETVGVGAFVRRTAAAGGRWWLDAGAAMLGDKNSVTGVLTGPLLLAAVFVAAWRRRGPWTAMGWLLVLYSVGVAITAFKGGARFAVPLTSVFWLVVLGVVCSGGGGLLGWRRVARNVSVVLLIAASLAGCVTVMHTAVRLHWGSGAERVRRGFELDPGHLEEIALLDAWVPASAPTLSDNALLMRHVTGRRVFPVVAESDPAATADRLTRWNIRYACIKKKWMRGDRPSFADVDWIRIAEGTYAVVLRRP